MRTVKLHRYRKTQLKHLFETIRSEPGQLYLVLDYSEAWWFEFDPWDPLWGLTRSKISERVKQHAVRLKRKAHEFYPPEVAGKFVTHTGRGRCFMHYSA